MIQNKTLKTTNLNIHNMKLTRNEIAAIKRVAATVQPDLNKKVKKQKEIAKLQEEIMEIDNKIAVWDQGIRNLTGLSVEQLVEREIVNGVTRFKIREDLLEVDEQGSSIQPAFEPETERPIENNIEENL